MCVFFHSLSRITPKMDMRLGNILASEEGNQQVLFIVSFLDAIYISFFGLC